jgi:glycerophosphoryl diester phosphodiesterase
MKRTIRQSAALALFGMLLLIAPLAPLAACASTRSGERDSAPSPTRIIAHRGASGYLPEHTLAAYAYAHALGADFIEPDVVLTSDGVPICSHDLYADATTNASDLFASRARIDERGVSRIFYADLSLAEVKRLSAHGRGNGGAPGTASGHGVPTLEEMIGLVRSLNEKTGRSVGIVPELKGPKFHADRGLALTKTVLDTLARHGYSAKTDREAAIVQCFELDAVREARFTHRSALELVYLVKSPPDDATLDDVRSWIDGLGPDKKLLDDAPDGLLARARLRGLRVYPYTFARDREALRRCIREFRVDGLFSDYPDIALEERARE